MMGCITKSTVVFCVLLALWNPIGLTDGKKILFISPSLSNSLLIQFGRLADLLVKDGHNVTYFIPEMNPFSLSDGSKLANIVRMRDVSDDFAKEFDDQDLLDPNFYSLRRRLNFAKGFVNFCRDIVKHREFLDDLKAQNFDLVFTNGLDYCDAGLTRYLEIPLHIWTVTGPLHEVNTYALGIPSPPSFLPTVEGDYLGSDLTFSERFANFLGWMKATYVHKYLLWNMNSVFRENIDPNFPSMDTIMSDASLLFVNDEEFLDYARPILHKVIYIAGAGISSPQPFDAKVEAIVAKGKKGFIGLSFGTVLPSTRFSMETKQTIIRMTAAFPDYHFVIQADAQDADFREAAKGKSNVDVLTWIPQSDLLGHPRMKLFISHGGFNTLYEASAQGVPLLVIPIQFDQLRNAKMIEHRGSGIIIQKNNISEHSLVSSVSELLHNPIYKQAAIRLSDLIQNKPNPPDETFLRWTNFVLEHGPLHELTPTGARLDLFVYYCIDILLLIIVVAITAIWVAVRLACIVKRMIVDHIKIKNE